MVPNSMTIFNERAAALYQAAAAAMAPGSRANASLQAAMSNDGWSMGLKYILGPLQQF